MRWALRAIAAVVPAPALALSCLPFGVTDAYLEAQASNDRYIVVVGDLTFDPAALPKTDWANQAATPDRAVFYGAMDGASWSGNRFGRAFVGRVTLNFECAGPWCASAETGQKTVAFLREVGPTYVADIRPCGGMIFQNVDRAAMRDLTQCLEGGPCAPSDLPR